ncbi:MAG: type II toxin-antitoxin system VapC family toxin [Deltaproteobacteria bacterium]|nr:type II toxin-antitoxin system VapC family toxin [Deltaproteobacteria bacterium]
MNLLLDTHILLWWLDDHPGLSERERRAIGDGENSVWVSTAVIWEVRIKQALGKLTLPSSFRTVLEEEPFLSLDVTSEHAHAVYELPMHHRDPFDRMLIAQAQVERFTLVTHDPFFKKYDIDVMEV